ncbi:hypothetical protein [Kutzneria buriramensis]|uniref:hypothetical protein n=1 Tax=Kutzneria buriramensis TaxID=1045776 RepID=UPI001B878B89|nr:hypothetical protein [Kutzneria buriramensis]
MPGFAKQTRTPDSTAASSPQVFWPDGSTTHNPGMTDRHWSGGLVRVGHTDPGEAERLLLASLPR